jgi:hypothetical protein
VFLAGVSQLSGSGQCGPPAVFLLRRLGRLSPRILEVNSGRGFKAVNGAAGKTVRFAPGEDERSFLSRCQQRGQGVTAAGPSYRAHPIGQFRPR